MDHSASHRGRIGALAPTAVLLLALCLLAGSVQGSYTPGIQRFVAGDVLEVTSANQTDRIVVASVDTTSLSTPYYTTYGVVLNEGRWEIPSYWHHDDRIDEQNLVENLQARRVGHVDLILVVITDPTVTGGDMKYTGLSLAEAMAGVIYPVEPAPGEPSSYPQPYVVGDILGNATDPTRGAVVSRVFEQDGATWYNVYLDTVRSGDRWMIEKFYNGDMRFTADLLDQNGMRRVAHADPHTVIVNDTTTSTGDMGWYRLSLAEVIVGKIYDVELWQDPPGPDAQPRYLVGDVLGNDTSATRFMVAYVTAPASGYPLYTAFPVVKNGTGWEIPRYGHGDAYLRADALQVFNLGLHRLDHTDLHFAIVTDRTITPGDVYFYGLSFGEILEGTRGYPPEEPIGPFPTPYRPHAVPGRIEAEDYDIGGFSDTTPGNSGGAYRRDDVDIETAGGITNVGWIRDGEVLKYTVTVAQSGSYAVKARMASPNSGRSVALVVDDHYPMVLTVPNTGSFTAYGSTVAPIICATLTPQTQGPAPTATGGPGCMEVPLALSAGTHTLTLTFRGDGQNIDWFELGSSVTPTPTPTPTPGSPTPYKPLSIPGTIQAEDYDIGGFSDITPGNSGGAYRHDDVDIESSGGVTNVGWIRSGEYLTYTATVQSAATYTMTARMACPNSGRTAVLSVDGVQAATIAVPNTGSFAKFGTVQVPVTLGAGTHTLKLAFQGDGQNIDWLAFASGAVVTTPTPTPTPGAGGASFTAAPNPAKRGAAVKFTVTPAAGKTIRSAWWSFDAAAHLNTWNSRTTNPTFYYPSAGTFSPLVRLTYTDGSTETAQRTGYVRVG